jgi:predicted RNA-binding Zn-ribbon protein involved in translation (DUF1610 family)
MSTLIEKHMASEYLHIAYKKSKIVPGKTIEDKWMLRCPSCQWLGDWPETGVEVSCSNCGLGMVRCGNTLELWKEEK